MDQIDFFQLSKRHSYLQKYLLKTSNGYTIDFNNPKAVRELCYAILFVQYNIQLEIPLDTLCPPVPNRMSYLQYIHKELLVKKNKSPVFGIDMYFTFVLFLK